MTGDKARNGEEERPWPAALIVAAVPLAIFAALLWKVVPLSSLNYLILGLILSALLLPRRSLLLLAALNTGGMLLLGGMTPVDQLIPPLLVNILGTALLWGLISRHDQALADMHNKVAALQESEQALKQQAERLKVMYEIDRNILAAASPEAVIQTALHNIRRLVFCNRAGVILFDFATQEIVVLAADMAEETELRAGRREVLEPYEPLISELQQGPVLLPLKVWRQVETIKPLQAAGSHFGVALPLISKNELIGSIILWSGAGAFPAEQLNAVGEVADHLALAVQQAWLLDETQRRVRELAGLHELVQALGTLTNVEETFGRLTERLAHLIEAPMCVVLLLDPLTGEMQAQSPGYGVKNSVLAAFRYSAQTAGQFWNFRERGPFVSNSSPEIPSFFHESLRVAAVLESVVAVPMWVKGRVIGQITACNKPGGFKEDDVRLLQVFANQAAVIIQNARLFEAEALRRQEAEALRNVASALNTTLNQEEVLDRILANVGEVAPHQGANIMLIEAGVARVARSRGYAEHGLEESVKTLRFTVAETSNLLWIVENSRPLVISDTETDPAWISSWIRSYVGAPVRLEAEVIGFLNLDSRMPGFFTQAHAERLQAFADQAAVAIANARLYAASEQRANRLKVLHAIDHAILTAQSPQIIAQTALHHIRRLVPYQQASLNLFDFAAEKAVIFGVKVEKDHCLDTNEQIPLHSFSNLEALAGTPYSIVEDITALVDPSPLQSRRWVEEEIRSHLDLPLIVRGELIGSLNLATIQPGSWPALSLEIAREVADQLAIALEQAHLYEQIRRHAEELEQRVADRTRELSALYEVTAVASEALTLEVTLEKSLQRVLSAMRSEAGAIHLLDETGQTLHLAVHQGLSPEIVLITTSVPSGNGLLSWVIEHGEPLVVSDVPSHPRLAHIPQLSMQAFVSVPMRARGRVLGILSVTRAKGQPPFIEEEIALLTSIAGQAGVVVESAWLRQQAEQAAVMAERARLARDLHDSVTQLLYSINLFAAAGREAYHLDARDKLYNCLVELGQVAQQALKEMRLLVYQLRPPALEHDGLVGALQHRLDAVEARAGVKARLLADKMLDLPGPVEEALYHITQEALNNALKHAGATSVLVQIRAPDQRVELEITDDGVGFDPEAVAGSGGLGLVSMRERADQLGGQLTLLSAAGKGTKVKVSMEISGKGGK